MSPSDRVQVGSIAMTLVATGVLQLVTLGRVDLDDARMWQVFSLRAET